MSEDENELDLLPEQMGPFTLYNGQFPKGKQFTKLADAESFLEGWRVAWVEDCCGNVLSGFRPSPAALKEET